LHTLLAPWYGLGHLGLALSTFFGGFPVYASPF